MELKAELIKPFSDTQRENFIVLNNHQKGYEIKETPDALQAWGMTNSEQLEKFRTLKYDEANEGAKKFLESGEALYEFSPGKHVEAFDGNMSKMTGYLLAFESGIYQPSDTVVWVTKEDDVVNLTKEQIADILEGIGKVQASVWSVQFLNYVSRIQSAKTVQELKSIEIQYSDDITLLNSSVTED